MAEPCTWPTPVVSATSLTLAEMQKRRTRGMAEVQQRGAMQGWRCKMCGDMFSGPYQLDHVLPFCLFGEEGPVFAICGTCHDFKTRVEGTPIRRTKSLLRRASAEHPTFAVCFMCGAVVSTYFHDHPCRIDRKHSYWHVRLT